MKDLGCCLKLEGAKIEATTCTTSFLSAASAHYVSVEDAGEIGVR